MKPVLLVIAGPNGAGKTTVTRRLLEDRWGEGVEYLNPDEVARDRFGDWNSPEAVLSAARWTADRREELLRLGESLAFETVLSKPDKLEFLERARDRGYFIRVFFIGTSDPAINGRRITERVIEGGHSVPIDKIVSRYARSLANLPIAARIADRAYVYDNSVENVEARLCARTEEGLVRKIYGESPEWVAAALRSLDPHPQLERLPR